MSGVSAGGPAIAFRPMLNTFQDVARQWPDSVGRRLEAAVAQAAAARRQIRTAGDARAYQRQRREAFWRAAGPLPLAPVAPDAPGVTRSAAYETHGSLTHLGVRIEKVTFESWPGMPVSALLYRTAAPAGAPRRPGVLFVCGHYGTAKQAAEFQRVYLDLALHGMVVLAIDPWGQGERFQYVVAGRPGPLVPGGTFEHSCCDLSGARRGDERSRLAGRRARPCRSAGLLALAAQRLTGGARRVWVRCDQAGASGIRRALPPGPALPPDGS